MSDCTIAREHDREGERALYRLGGSFDRSSAWALRARIEREEVHEVLLDFSLIGDFSDLAIAVLAHGIMTSTHRIALRGLRQHQLRIFQYCGVAVDEIGASGAGTRPLASPAGEHRVP